jgi:hypothetical protein
MAPFASTIESLTNKYDNYTVDTPLMQVRQKMEKVKMIMIENVDQLMQKGDKIELLVMRTQSLHTNAMKYDKADFRIFQVEHKWPSEESPPGATVQGRSAEDRHRWKSKLRWWVFARSSACAATDRS